jgi:2-oxoglutarate ferredoxin oxidoreductase subunit beta
METLLPLGWASYVARSFAGDPKQLVPLLEGALSHSGTAMLDIISPCVTFNNHESSTKSYKWAKEHEELLHQIDFIPHFEPINEVQYEEGETKEVEMHDGSHIRLRKLERDYDPMSKEAALRMLGQTREAGDFLTGLIYVNPVAKNFIDLLGLSETPLAAIPDDQSRPGSEVLEEVMRELM